jgi:uncharacterized protein (TIGR02145 family)
MASNVSGFSGAPGGYRYGNGDYENFGVSGNWWSSSEGGTLYAWSRYLDYDFDGANRNGNDKRYGFSVRCLRD